VIGGAAAILAGFQAGPAFGVGVTVFMNLFGAYLGSKYVT
jgi:hypothetical protein